VGTGDPMDMGVNPYPLVYISDPIELFFIVSRYRVLIPGGYLFIAISTCSPKDSIVPCIFILYLWRDVTSIFSLTRLIM
jgi:hypothetical protein